MDRVILHCDLNSFYASVELLDHPELQVRQRPKTLIFGQRAFFAGIKRNKAFLQKIGSKFSIGIAQNAVNRQAFCLQAFQQTGL